MTKAIKELEVGNLNFAAVKVLNFNRPSNGYCFRTHWHDRFEFIHVTEGDMVIEYNDKVITLKAGETAILSPRTVHRGYTANSSVKYHALLFDIRSFYNETPVCNDILPDIFDGRITFNPKTDNSEIFLCIDKIINSQSSLKTVSLVYRLLYLLLENEARDIKPQPHSSVKAVVEYIEANFASELSTATLSRQFGYSNEHFCRKFKEATGLSPMTYLKIFRLETAYKLIKNGEGNISSVAMRCGFNDANYFTRCFKKHFGHPPRDCGK